MHDDIEDALAAGASPSAVLKTTPTHSVDSLRPGAMCSSTLRPSQVIAQAHSTASRLNHGVSRSATPSMNRYKGLASVRSRVAKASYSFYSRSVSSATALLESSAAPPSAAKVAATPPVDQPRANISTASASKRSVRPTNSSRSAVSAPGVGTTHLWGVVGHLAFGRLQPSGAVAVAVTAGGLVAARVVVASEQIAGFRLQRLLDDILQGQAQ